MELDINSSPQLTKGELIEQKTADLIEQCSKIYGSGYENIARRLLIEKDISLTSDDKIISLLRQIEELENQESDDNNPYIKLISMQ